MVGSDSALVLIHDAIDDLLNNNTDTALTHLSMARKQLELPDHVNTSAISLNKTSELNAMFVDSANGQVNETAIREQNYPPFFNQGKHDEYCYTSGYENGGRVFFNVTTEQDCLIREQVGTTSGYYVGFVHGCQAAGQFQDTCVFYAKTSLESEPQAQVQGQVNVTAIQEQNFPPFFDPGYLEGDDYTCYSNGYNDGTQISYSQVEDEECGHYFGGFVNGCQATGRTETECAGIPSATSETTDAQQIGISNMTGNITSEEYCEDFDGDGFCDITHLADGTTMIEDQEEIERFKEGNDGMPETQQRQQPGGSISVPVQPQQNRINWGAICRNPIVDSFISEPCDSLTSPDGFTLTSRGHRVLACLGVGGIATILAPEILASVRSLGPAVGCGSNTGGEPSPLGQGNPLGTMLGGLIRK